MPAREPVQGKSRLTLSITVKTKKGPVVTEYRVVYLWPEKWADPAWRLTKLVDGKLSDVTYDIHLGPYGPECTCPDFIYCRENQEKKCKHCEAITNLGLLRIR